MQSKLCLSVCVALLACLAGCQKEDPAERAGKELDQAMQETQEGLEEAGKELAEAAEEVKGEVKDAVKEACEETREATGAKETGC